jgi:hypothetical protein
VLHCRTLHKDALRIIGRWIESNILLQLASAPFDKQDETLVPEAGSCLNCPKRTGLGESTSSALRNAKLDLLARYGDQLRPSYWAAFITVGETSTRIGIKKQ